jgi:hypothetical protein
MAKAMRFTTTGNANLLIGIGDARNEAAQDQPAMPARTPRM